MKIEWTHRNGSRRLILIFAGWSTDASFYSHISHEGWDVAVVYGYSDLTFPLSSLDRYTTIALFAWSMGVYVASKVIPGDIVSVAVAVNGTEYPVDDSMGIPEKIFDGTISALDERNLAKFRRRMSGSRYKELTEKFACIKTDISTLSAELRFIRKISSTRYESSLKWHRAYISDNDAIFPADSQQRAWLQNAAKPQILHLDNDHYVDLAVMIRGILPEEGTVGKRFEKAVSTYESQATAQQAIASHLVEICPDKTFQNIIEIGPGTGLFTRMIIPKIRPARIEFVDLFPLSHFNLVNEEKYHVADAERWFEEEADKRPHSFDAIVSASAIQWFANPRRFFQNAARLLKDGGLLLCSSFLPGNLSELTDMAPFGLIYRSEEEISSYLNEYFADHSISDEKLTVEFSSPRDTLLHLKQTGVGGGSSTSMPLGKMLSAFPSRLTYRPIYIKAYSNTSISNN